jgi:hypothetical protein
VNSSELSYGCGFAVYSSQRAFKERRTEMLDTAAAAVSQAVRSKQQKYVGEGEHTTK